MAATAPLTAALTTALTMVSSVRRVLGVFALYLTPSTVLIALLMSLDGSLDVLVTCVGLSIISAELLLRLESLDTGVTDSANVGVGAALGVEDDEDGAAPGLEGPEPAERAQEQPQERRVLREGPDHEVHPERRRRRGLAPA